MEQADWLELTRKALAEFTTPFYLFAYPPVETRVEQLKTAIAQAGIEIPVTQFLSLKTLPLPDLLREWHARGRSVEVTSETELAMTLTLGVPGTRIVINGVGKHHWLPAVQEPNLTVIFDSLAEVAGVLEHAIRLNWRLGLRVAVSTQIDPDFPTEPAQFGMSPEDAKIALRMIRAQKAVLEVLHFHLRSNVSTVEDFYTALEECHALVEDLPFRPKVLDVGGGLPDPEVKQRGQIGSRTLQVSEYAQFLRDAARTFADVRELWLENGRYLLGPSGKLLITVIDTKWIGLRRFLICDGGRTNHALESDWEEHEVFPVKGHSGSLVPTTICGPNCMAYDWIFRGPFSEKVGEGDQIVYSNAGAYHLPWESRFSRGLCQVLWSPEGVSLRRARQAESVSAILATWAN